LIAKGKGAVAPSTWEVLPGNPPIHLCPDCSLLPVTREEFYEKKRLAPTGAEAQDQAKKKELLDFAGRTKA
jgi:hypothetical protein